MEDSELKRRVYGSKVCPGRPAVISREEVVEAALSILDVSGVGELSVRSLGRCLGTGKSTLYNYFSSMEDVKLAVAEKLLSGLPRLRASSDVPLRFQLVELVLSLHDLPGARYELVSDVVVSKETEAGWLIMGEGIDALVSVGVDLERAAITLRLLRDFAISHGPRATRLAAADPESQYEYFPAAAIEGNPVFQALSKTPMATQPYRKSLVGAIEMIIDRMLPELSADMAEVQ